MPSPRAAGDQLPDPQARLLPHGGGGFASSVSDDGISMVFDGRARARGAVQLELRFGNRVAF